MGIDFWVGAWSPCSWTRYNRVIPEAASSRAPPLRQRVLRFSLFVLSSVRSQKRATPELNIPAPGRTPWKVGRNRETRKSRGEEEREIYKVWSKSSETWLRNAIAATLESKIWEYYLSCPPFHSTELSSFVNRVLYFAESAFVPRKSTFCLRRFSVMTDSKRNCYRDNIFSTTFRLKFNFILLIVLLNVE